jgi:hypothetical protein
MFRPATRLLGIAVGAALFSACVPPRERVEGLSPDGSTRVSLDLRPAGIDSVLGTGTLQVAGQPHTVVVTGRWNDVGDGVRSLEATLQSDTTPAERWAIEWSTTSLEGSLRHTSPGASVARDIVPIATP